MNDFLLSIIIPSYNSGNCIERCVTSIFKAGELYLGDFEVIIVNDGSTDNTYEVCSRLSNNYDNLVLINKNNDGVSAARNTGMEVARGFYIGFCDSDDSVTDSYFDAIIPLMKSQNIDIISFGYYTYYFTNNIMKLNVTNQKRYTNDTFIRKMFSTDAIGGFVWNKIFKKQIVIGAVFKKKITICEDLEFIFGIVSGKKDLNIQYISLGLYIYYHNTSSASRRLSNLFDDNGSFKYSDTISYILKNGGSYYESFLRSKIFDCALTVLLNNVISRELNDENLTTLKKHLNGNFLYFIKNRDVSLLEKTKNTIFYLFPEIKSITNKS